MQKPLMITAAIVGAETMREHTPHVPYTPEEIAHEATLCRQEGAVMTHVHGRLDDGTPTQSKAVFQRILNEIRQNSDILVQFSTGGAVWMDVEERIEALELKPDMATLTTGSVNFGDDIFANALPTIKTIAQRLKHYDIRPEIEIFEVGMIDTARKLIDKGLLDDQVHFDFVLGVPGAMSASIRNLHFLVESIPSHCTWSVAGIGRHELPMAYEAIKLGGHVRVGLEDNVYISRGQLAKGSWELVRHVAQYASSQHRQLASIAQAKTLLQIK